MICMYTQFIYKVINKMIKWGLRNFRQFLGQSKEKAYNEELYSRVGEKEIDEVLLGVKNK